MTAGKDTPRTWTLVGYKGFEDQPVVKQAELTPYEYGPSLREGEVYEGVEVIEAKPVLDLLELICERGVLLTADEVEIRAVLRSCGRLGDAG